MTEQDDGASAGGVSDGLASPARRQLLQIGAAGLAAVAASSGASLLARDAQNAVTPRGSEAAPPSADGVIDPSAIAAETWTEPWIWRPADWPGQTLDLNVV